MTKAVMGVRKFRETFPSLTTPTEVIRATKGMERLGVWYPNEQRTFTTEEAVHDGSSGTDTGRSQSSHTTQSITGGNPVASESGAGAD